MNIKCPKCHARASLPDSKQGAKVKCGECGRIFIAAPIGTRVVHSQGPNTGVIIGVGVGVVALLGFLIVSNSVDDDSAKATVTPIVAAAETKAPWVDPMKWEGPVVQAAVGLHESVANFDEHRLRSSLDAARIWSTRQAAEADGDGNDGDGVAGMSFASLSATQRDTLLAAYADELLEGASRELVGDWKPYDGEVTDLAYELATVRLYLTPRDEDAGVERRTIDWKLSRDGDGPWRAYSWKRWLSPRELAAERVANRGYEKVTLSDGSKVLEREPEPLEHLATTPDDVRATIDRLYATMIDLDLTREGIHARDEITLIGRPAIPILLTGLYKTPLDTEDNAIIANIIVMALRDITDQYFGYKPQLLVGSAAGTTEERRQSAIKQWFAWWHLNKRKFQEKEERVDGLEGLIELDDKDKAWLERNKD